jgi:type II secretion system protein H
MKNNGVARRRFAGVALSRRRAFTLMEIMVVVVIVAVLFVVTLPSLRSVNDNNRLRSSMREIISLMNYARSEAVFNGRTTEVFLDTKKNEFWLDLRKPNEKRIGSSSSDKRKSTMERKRELEQNVQFEAINAIEKNILKNDVIAVDFYPDGTASPALITLKNTRDTRYTIEVFKSTGQVEISKTDLDTVALKSGAAAYPLPDNYYEGMAGGGN